MIKPAETLLPLPLQDAEIKALRSFWRGVVVGVVLGFVAGAMLW